MKIGKIKDIQILGWVSANVENENLMEMDKISTASIMRMDVTEAFNNEEAIFPLDLDVQFVEDFWAILNDVSEEAALEFYNKNK